MKKCINSKKNKKVGVAKRLLVLSLVLTYMCIATACTRDNKDNNGDMAGTGVQTETGATTGNGIDNTTDTTTNGTNTTTDTTTTDTTTTDTTTTDTTTDENHNNTHDGSILEDAGNAVGDVVEDAANGVSDITNDLVGNENETNTSSTTTAK